MAEEWRLDFTNDLLRVLTEVIVACRVAGYDQADHQRLLDQIRALTPTGRRAEVEFPGG